MKTNLQHIEAAESKKIGTATLLFFNDLKARNFEFVLGKLEPGEKLEPHYHKPPTEEIYYVYAGECTVIVGDERVKATQGTAIFVPPDVVHYPINTGNKTCWIAFVLGPGREESIVLVDEKSDS